MGFRQAVAENRHEWVKPQCALWPEMTFYSLMDSAAYWALRLAGCALINLGEDAALMALMFC